MFPLKKSLLLLFFFGPISLSFCEKERKADKEENGGEVPEKEVRRIIPNCNYKFSLANCFGKKRYINWKSPDAIYHLAK
uniref:OGC-RA1 peptide n=1 Tax=Odorrana andersonii TaxID=369514 RepID=E3SZJ0_ODOAN|nr:OGC-RA1 peptide precursor [Odorrana andersonii]